GARERNPARTFPTAAPHNADLGRALDLTPETGFSAYCSIQGGYTSCPSYIRLLHRDGRYGLRVSGFRLLPTRQVPGSKGSWGKEEQGFAGWLAFRSPLFPMRKAGVRCFSIGVLFLVQ